MRKGKSYVFWKLQIIVGLVQLCFKLGCKDGYVVLVGSVVVCTCFVSGMFVGEEGPSHP